MESEGWLPRSVELSTGPYPEPDQLISQHLILSEIHFNIILPPSDLLPSEKYRSGNVSNWDCVENSTHEKYEFIS
jgi:hypothetical protein